MSGEGSESTEMTNMPLRLLLLLLLLLLLPLPLLLPCPCHVSRTPVLCCVASARYPTVSPAGLLLLSLSLSLSLPLSLPLERLRQRAVMATRKAVQETS